MAAYEDIDKVLGRIMSFAGLLYQQNTQDMDRAKFLGDMQGRIRSKGIPTIFICERDSIQTQRKSQRTRKSFLKLGQSLQGAVRQLCVRKICGHNFICIGRQFFQRVVIKSFLNGKSLDSEFTRIRFGGDKEES